MRASNRGFTLLEILVALVVLAIAMAAVLKTLAAQASNSDYLQQRTLAGWVAQNRYAELRLLPQWPDAGEQRGSTQFAGQQWEWRSRISNTDDADVRRVDIAVAQGKQDYATLIGYLGRTP